MCPLVLTVLPTGGAHVYYDDGRCVCGHDTFIRISSNGYFKYAPGHGVPERREFSVRPHGDEWEVLGLPHSAWSWSPLEGEDKVIARVRIRDGALYESWGSSTNWTRHARIHNPYRIWIAKLMEKF